MVGGGWDWKKVNSVTVIECSLMSPFENKIREENLAFTRAAEARVSMLGCTLHF